MKKKYRLMTRALCVLLSLCAAAAIILPAAIATAPEENAVSLERRRAAALAAAEENAVSVSESQPEAAIAASTPEQEAVLDKGQRSINNPDGIFILPEPDASLRLFHPDTWQAASMIIENALEQLFQGNSDPEAIGRIMAQAPIVKESELPLRGEWDDSMQYMMQNGFRNVYIALRETAEPDVYQLITIFTTRHGEMFYVPQGILYHAATGWITSTSGDGILGIGFDYNVGHLTRATDKGWQRTTGYNRLFDLLAPMLLIYIDTMRVPFSYDGRDYMVQIWKGLYGPSNGAEIGLYEKDPKETFFWDASDLNLEMSMMVYQGDELFLDCGTQNTWWIGVFRYGSYTKTPLLPASGLRLTGSITFEDPDMLAAFLEAFEQSKDGRITGTVDGLMFSFDWR
ncbi:MAG: DUF4474 domain-containing protein [Oscillospiraceae bacterium]|nr:DUF4474 domain-containing protein [Oscillospiraceae bacterium]